MSLPALTRVGPVTLRVRDLASSLEFYTSRLGFEVRKRDDGGAHLGAGAGDLLVLRAAPLAVRVPGTTGLYHFAVLLPSRAALARSLRQLLDQRTPLTGFADHGVSEAIYLSDPEGNGIELYRDRPRAEWPLENGALAMISDPLDLDAVLAAESAPKSGGSTLSGETVIGHMHLHVTHLDPAREFYVDVLGFDLMQRFGRSAMFVSAGGYHHHVGLNVWQGEGAPPPPENAAGLDRFAIRLPDAASLEEVKRRVLGAGLALDDTSGGFVVRDPSRNRIELRVD
jgi:catechol 2,3-dioxygenase